MINFELLNLTVFSQQSNNGQNENESVIEAMIFYFFMEAKSEYILFKIYFGV